MKRKILFCLALFSAFVPNVWADTIPGAPQNPGSALIIYNARGYTHPEFSQGAMETFLAALSQDYTKIKDPIASGRFDANSIPPISPPLTRVNILNVTTHNGIDGELKAKFYNSGNQTIDGFSFEGDIFCELYDAGNPLAYWSQVYDLRFANIYSENETVTTPATITLTGDRSDKQYFGEHLKSGGTLYLQAEYNGFRNRNYGIADLIKSFTADEVPLSVFAMSGQNKVNFQFYNDFENFAVDFNDLNSLVKAHSMYWSNAGGVPTSYIQKGHSLVTDGATTIMAAWGAKPEEMNPLIGNGRLIIGFDINAWGDFTQSIISKTTFAIIQNLYDLMDGSKQFGVEKRFIPAPPEPLGLGEIGTCVITVNNIGNYLIENIIVNDTLSSCFQYISTEGAIQPTKSPASGTTGGVLEWNVGDIGGRQKKEIKFKFKVVDTNCN